MSDIGKIRDGKKSCEAKLEEYAHELGIGLLLIDSLIESHRSLRLKNIEFSRERIKILSQARKEAYEEAYAYAIHNLYFTAKQLKSMTIGELVEKLKES